MKVIKFIPYYNHAPCELCGLDEEYNIVKGVRNKNVGGFEVNHKDKKIEFSTSCWFYATSRQILRNCDQDFDKKFIDARVRQDHRRVLQLLANKYPGYTLKDTSEWREANGV